MHTKIRARRKTLAYQPVSVLIRAALPRTMRIAEVDGDPGVDPQAGVLCKRCTVSFRLTFLAAAARLDFLSFPVSTECPLNGRSSSHDYVTGSLLAFPRTPCSSAASRAS